MSPQAATEHAPHVSTFAASHQPPTCTLNSSVAKWANMPTDDSLRIDFTPSWWKTRSPEQEDFAVKHLSLICKRVEPRDEAIHGTLHDYFASYGNVLAVNSRLRLEKAWAKVRDQG